VVLIEGNAGGSVVGYESASDTSTDQEAPMSTRDRASNRTQDAKGRVKEAAGAISGNRDLKNKGKTDQVKAASKNRGDDLKDAARKVKRAVTK
jgi:uncharacterized protein YjbJ (UPF0337 family)